MLLCSIHSLLLPAEGGYRDTAMWLVPDRKASVIHLQGTPIPAVDSRAYCRVSQMVPTGSGREHLRDEPPLRVSVVTLPKLRELTQASRSCPGPGRIHGRTSCQLFHLSESQFPHQYSEVLYEVIGMHPANSKILCLDLLT